MLRKLFSCLLPQPKHAPRRRRRCHKKQSKNLETGRPDAVDSKWTASLPNNLFLEILLRLEPAAVVCCAGVCKPWRRAIIVDNVSILGPHLDRFFRPSLLLGIFFHFHYDIREEAAWLQRTPGPFQSALPSSSSNGCGGWVPFLRKQMNTTPANSLIPAAASAGALPTLLSSRDGFILLTARSRRSAKRLCLCNPVTGYCTIVPAAAGRCNTYILLTAGAAGGSSSPAVCILAVHRRRYYDNSRMIFLNREPLAYQTMILSTSTSGDGDDRAGAHRVWGPVVQSSSSELVPAAGFCVRTDHRRTVQVWRDDAAVVYWLAGPGTAVVTCVFALDVRTGRTWTTAIPHQAECVLSERDAFSSILATSSGGDDGRQRLSLIRSLFGRKIQVWVLSDDDDNAGQWTLHRTIAVDGVCQTGGGDDIFPRGHWIYLSAFCPRSRCVVAMWSDQVLLIDVDGSSGGGCIIRRIGERRKGHRLCCPYEIDSSSTYISRMMHLLLLMG